MLGSSHGSEARASARRPFMRRATRLSEYSRELLLRSNHIPGAVTHPPGFFLARYTELKRSMDGTRPVTLRVSTC